MEKLKAFKTKYEHELQKLKNTDKLHDYVINDILSDLLEDDGYNELKSHVELLATYGCVSGLIPSLMFYTDTTKFFEKFKSEINDILKEKKDNCGSETITKILDGDFFAVETTTKNNLAWIGYEEVNYKLLRLLEEFEETEKSA